MIEFDESEADDFVPNWASPPGDTVKDILEVKGMDSTQLAFESGIPLEEVEAILSGKLEINAFHAHGLEMAFQVPVSFWINREQQYRKALKRLQGEAAP